MSAATGSDIDDLLTDTNSSEFRRYATEEYGEGVDEEIESFLLSSEDFISGPFLSEQCTIPENILELDYSFGYDCKRYFNLVAVDPSTLVFASGNIIHFFNVRNKDLWFRRSYLGGGIGHITTNPSVQYAHLTVAENGDNPPIIIYQWPTLNIVGVLKGGAAKRYAHINYSPDGELLVSQSYGPDFLITVWRWKNWRHSPIILRIKSHVNDIFKVMFSPYVPGHITTGGAGHIKFWKMAETFTGLKLQGDLGRFGKTEITDIVGIYPMPDEKVISGSEWGNILVWEAGLIKVEVFRTLRRHCHAAPVMQFLYDKERKEIWTISQDGWLRAWSYRVIDEADPPDEDRIVQVMPSYERECPGVQFMCICKKKLYDFENTLYYAQDGNGGIWLIDLALGIQHEQPTKLFNCHAGVVVSLGVCPWGPYLLSLGEDGHVHIYNYLDRSLLYMYHFNAKGRALLWLPLSIDLSGAYIIAGFDDGVIRVCAINLKKEDGINLTIVQSTKPHNKPVTAITMNPAGTIFVSAGEDNTLFVYAVQKIQLTRITLIPIGYVRITSYATFFTWHPTSVNVLLVGCLRGELYEYNLPENTMDYTDISYHLYTIQPQTQTFITCKAQIRRDEHLQEVETRKAEKLIRKQNELAKIKAENPGLEIDEEAYLLDSESEEVLEPLYIPEVPNRIWFAKYTPEDTIWLSMGGYDAGYIYEYQMNQTTKEPLKATIIEDGDDIEMHGYIYSYDGKYLITSMENGSIRINQENPEDFRDLSNYWLLSMHDNFNGHITSMCFSYDHKYFFSSGVDGNIFSYLFKPEEEIEVPKPSSIRSKPSIVAVTRDEDYGSLCLEEKMIKAEEEKQLALANQHKEKLRVKLRELTNRLTSILRRNCAMPKSQRYLLKEFIIDDRIMQALDERLESKIALEKRKLAFDVEKSTVALQKLKAHYTDIMDVFPISIHAINTPETVYTLAQRALGSIFYDMKDMVAKKILEEQQKGRVAERIIVVHEAAPEIKKRQQELEPFLIGLSPSTIAFKLGAKITRLLTKYRERRMRQEKRQEEWTKLYACKPIEGANHPDDEKAIKIAKLTIGDYKLKTSADYIRPENMRETTVIKFEQLLEARLRAYKTMVHLFNTEVYDLRDRKVTLIRTLTEWHTELLEIQDQLPINLIAEIPAIPELTAADFPEANLDVVVEDDSIEDKNIKSKEAPVIKESLQNYSTLEQMNLAFNYQHNDVEGNTDDILNACGTLSFAVQESTVSLLPDETDDNTDTYWERELRVHRLFKNLKRQEYLINRMKDEVQIFDREVQKLSDRGLHVAVDANFMDLYLLLLNQELVIVKDFEAVELDLQKKVCERVDEMLDMRDSITLIENKIEAHQHIISAGVDRIKEIQQLFTNSAKDSAFWDFLKRIFKKKYKPPRVYDPDVSESSSASSDSSSESEDAFSLESGEIGPIRLDENVCPKGCDKELYELTFSLRSQRHELEKQAKEEVKNIETLKKEVEGANKKMKTIDIAVKQRQVELEEFQRIKQKQLNELAITIILRLSQMQHFSDDVTQATDILVFNATTLSKLYSRVSELQIETLQERARHNKNKIHLRRMNIDCKYMRDKIIKLKKEITETMKTQFGSKIDVNDVEEAVLKRLIQTLRLSLSNISALYEADIKAVKKSYAEHHTQLKTAIEENTARLELLDILLQEKADLIRLLDIQKDNTQKSTRKTEIKLHFMQDIKKLEKVSEVQIEQIEALKSEIKMLSSKTIPMKPISGALHGDITRVDFEKLPQVEEAEDMILEELESYDVIYVKPEEQIQPVSPIEEPDENVTEEDIISCVKELIIEIIESAARTEQTAEKIVTKIISSILAQVPTQYFLKDDSLEQIRTSVRSVVNVETEQLDTSRIKQDILGSRTTVTAETENIIQSILDTIFPEE